MDFASVSIRSMSMSTLKSALQTGIGAMSRRAKLRAERIILSSNGSMECHAGVVTTTVSNVHTSYPDREYGYFGNPAVRAISKLCAVSMQLTLKVKSSSTVSDSSPTLSLLGGSLTWLSILHDGSVLMLDESHKYKHRDMMLCFSIFDKSSGPESERSRLVKAFIHMVSSETGKTFDPAEYECMFMLLVFVCSSDPSPSTGIAPDIDVYYGEFGTIQRWSMCFVAKKYLSTQGIKKTSSTLIESLMLGDHLSVRYSRLVHYYIRNRIPACLAQS